jgi:hypothetical protein
MVVFLIYTFSLVRTVNFTLAAIILNFLFYSSSQYISEKKLRQMFWSMEKYFIWYYIANFVMPTKLIISYCASDQE